MRATVQTVYNFVQAHSPRLTDTLVLEHVREVPSMIARFHDWDWLRTTGQITAVADYTTGTVAVSQGSTAVTFTGATLTNAMITRHFQAGATDGSAGRWYQFRSINTGAGTAVLVDPYEGDTDADATFCIRQRYYRLPPDFRKAEVGKESSGHMVVFWHDRAQFEAQWSTISASGQVMCVVPAVASPTTLYDTGTFAATTGSPTITIATGVVNEARDRGRRFVAPQFPWLGDFTIIAVSEGGNTYTLDRNWNEMTVSGQGFYQVDPSGEPQVELFPAPSSGNSSVQFYYYRNPPALYQQTDYPTWPAEMNEVWKQAALLRCFAPKPSDFEAEFGVLMSSFMRRQGFQSNVLIRAGKWGIGTSLPVTNLPWNFPATPLSGRG
jgi:hypothetical protein